MVDIQWLQMVNGRPLMSLDQWIYYKNKIDLWISSLNYTDRKPLFKREYKRSTCKLDFLGSRFQFDIEDCISLSRIYIIDVGWLNLI